MRVAASDAPTPRTIVMLHGLFGRGRNWLGIARALVDERPDYQAWLVDLPHHGESGPGAHGDTVAGLARDVRDWMAAGRVAADAILGHSYGGKVALAIAAAAPRAPLQVWAIDSTPEVKPPSGSAWEMLRVVRGLPARFASRDEAVEAIVAGGFPVAVGRWMATNLVREGEMFTWRLDFDAMERLLMDFFATDLWAAIERPGPAQTIHILKASRSSAISPAAAARIAAAAADRVHLHEREGGHWIHAESPDVVTALLAAHLPRS
jgi:pimeloyl-ACP methyl ester carboxylesterase